MDGDLRTSTRQRYEQFRTREIEFYKQVISHRSLMRLAALATERVSARQELPLGDMALALEVDAIIVERMALPTFQQWRRAREGSRRQHRQVGATTSHQTYLDVPSGPASRGAVLVMQPRNGELWEWLCEDGRHVVIVEPDAAERAAIDTRVQEAGWSLQVCALADRDTIGEQAEFDTVVYSPAACADLSHGETADLIEALKETTAPGGVHVVDGLLREREGLPRSLLRSGYQAWTTRTVRERRSWRLVAERPTRGVARSAVL